jgi:hypothetical protein
VADATSRAISRSNTVAPITRQLLLGARQGFVSSLLDKLEASSRLPGRRPRDRARAL